MTIAELADHWDAEAETAYASAQNTRSLSLYEQLNARGSQLRQCATQLRLAAGITAKMAEL